jgi:hypothetical protein
LYAGHFARRGGLDPSGLNELDAIFSNDRRYIDIWIAQEVVAQELDFPQAWRTAEDLEDEADERRKRESMEALRERREALERELVRLEKARNAYGWAALGRGIGRTNTLGLASVGGTLIVMNVVGGIGGLAVEPIMWFRGEGWGTYYRRLGQANETLVAEFDRATLTSQHAEVRLRQIEARIKEIEAELNSLMGQRFSRNEGYPGRSRLEMLRLGERDHPQETPFEQW